MSRGSASERAVLTLRYPPLFSRVGDKSNWINKGSNRQRVILSLSYALLSSSVIG